MQFPQVLNREANALLLLQLLVLSFMSSLLSLTLSIQICFGFFFLILFFLIKSQNRLLTRKCFHENWQVPSYSMWLWVYFFELSKGIQPPRGWFASSAEQLRSQRQRRELRWEGRRKAWTRLLITRQSNLEKRTWREKMIVAT